MDTSTRRHYRGGDYKPTTDSSTVSNAVTGSTTGVETPQPTTGNAMTTDTETSTADDPSTAAAIKGNGDPVGIGVGVTLTLMLLLVALVACFVWRRKGGKRFWKDSDG